MAIKQVVSEGIGFAAGVIGFTITEGFGALSAGGGGGGGTLPTTFFTRDL